MANPILTWVLERASEKSTIGGLITLAATVGLNVTNHAGLIETVVTAVAGLALVLVKEARPLTAPVIVEDVANAVASNVVQLNANTAVQP